jgi:hypothetical protein
MPPLAVVIEFDARSELVREGGFDPRVPSAIRLAAGVDERLHDLRGHLDSVDGVDPVVVPIHLWNHQEVTVGCCLDIVAGDDERLERRLMFFHRRRLDLETRVDATQAEGGVA